MKVIIGETTYTSLFDLTFAPETDVTGSDLPINQFIVHIKTDDDIENGQHIRLYDDLDNLWAHFWLTDAYRIEEHTVEVTAVSFVGLLDRIMMPATIYTESSNTTVYDIISSAITSAVTFFGENAPFEIDTEFQSISASGYVEEQTARQRVQQALFVGGGICKQTFSEKCIFTVRDEEAVFIPRSITKWRPEVGYSEQVTAIRIRSYTYTAGTPASTDKWVEADGAYYIQTFTDYTIGNPEADELFENVVEVTDVTLINDINVSEILTRLSEQYFIRGEVTAEIVGNNSYVPGQKVQLFTGEMTAYEGFIKSMDFTFGLQASSKIQLTQAEGIIAAALVVVYSYGNTIIRVRRYGFPVGYTYSFNADYVQRYSHGHKYVYYPLTPVISGTMPEGGTTVYVDCEVALDQHISIRTLDIYSVDEVETDTDDNLTIMVIS